MPVTIPPVPTPVPQASDPTNFDARADAMLGWFPGGVAAMNSQNAENNALNADTTAKASEAAAAAAAAAASAAAAATSANAPAWVSGTTYAVGDVVYSTAAKTTYRRLVAGAGSTDPSLDAVNWEPFGASIVALPGRTPMAQPNGMLHPSWLGALGMSAPVNDIGIPGTAGFGVGICPALPAGFVPLPGCHDRLSANYGNYQFSDGSVMAWIPAFWLRLAHEGNPTFAAYGANSVDIKPLSAFADATLANASGYYLHRAFINAGANQPGFFRDKYDCSLNGNIASSIKGVQPMVSGPEAGQVGFSGATANGQTPTNNYAGAIAAARSRGAKFFPETIFMADALTRISEAHAQAATSTAHCAWWSAGNTNFPKGNNNNALRDTNDTTVQFTGAGNATHPAFALAGSGAPFAKTTHNGQACGVADVNGNIYKINPGLTCVAASKNITGATQTNPARLTIAAHGYTTGTVAWVEGLGGMTALNDRMYTLTVVDANTISLDGVDGTTLPAYTSGGSVTVGTFYALKESANIETLTAGNTSATDAWGATGVAAHSDPVTLGFATTYPNNSVSMRYGNGAAPVFGWASATERTLSMLGMPLPGGVSTTGTATYGNDPYYQCIRNELCVISRGSWAGGSRAGVRFRHLGSALPDANSAVGFAASRYL